MKLRFEPDLDFQLQAVEAVCDLFRGEEICQTEFTITKRSKHQTSMGFAESDLGIGNRLTLTDDEVLANLQDIQCRNHLLPSESLESGDFTVEMETGTGKTYVYLRTILELNKRYGFTKFVIVVPSVAIKEGVYKTLQITNDHFRTLYSGTFFEYFLYDSAKLNQVRNFATSQQVQIMVVTVGSINKPDINVLYKDNEKTGGETPIDLIKTTRPILIVDEPQSVDGGLVGRGRQALKAMNPLCTLRYSATHVDRHHMVYRLDAVDAYERKLVKQIEVASATVENAYNTPYVRVISTRNQSGVITAKVELHVETPSGSVRHQNVTVQDGYDLEQETGRAVYRNCRIGEIRVEKGNEFVELRVPGGEQYLRIGEIWGGVNIEAVHRQMIHRTIREHLNKEMRLHPYGIKVLSLFFIDAVERYRQYDEEGNPIKGEYAKIFEEEYKRLANHPDYRVLFENIDSAIASEEVHNGYFSIDRRGKWFNTVENNQAGRDNAERAYDLIMKEKEKLLSLNTPLKFIFSHSALREGWDNPNVFQICALRDIQTEQERRQTIGRGLRLCVNQKGERQHKRDINTLTVIARESFEEFAEKLQQEIEQDTGIRFGIIERQQFATIITGNEKGQAITLGFEESQALYEHLRMEGYIDDQGQIRDSLLKALQDDSLQIPKKFTSHRAAIVSVLRKSAGQFDIKDANEREKVGLRRDVLDSSEFKALWDRIKHKTTYRVEFDNDDLREKCAAELHDMQPVPSPRIRWHQANIAIGQGGVEAEETGETTVSLGGADIERFDIMTELQNRTQLTRRSIQYILCESGRLKDFKRNPQQFIELAAQTINRCKQLALGDGIKYQRLGDDSYYAQERFQEEELIGYLKNMRDAKKSIYEKVVYESDTEARFAGQLENDTAVKVYAKLPKWFTLPTPLGRYNPDWAVVIESDDGDRVYFVVETKASTIPGELRPAEKVKIKCGKAHFKALRAGEAPAKYKVVKDLEELLAYVDGR